MRNPLPSSLRTKSCRGIGGPIVLAPIRLLAGYMASHFPTLMDINLPMPMRRSVPCLFRGRSFQITQIELTAIRWFRRGAEVICSNRRAVALAFAFRN